MIPFIVAAFVIGAVALGLWWLLVHTEGVYLGRRVVIWLYDLYAPRYDDAKETDDVSEHLTIAQPLLNQLGTVDPMVLDVACGTGRVALALCQHARFEGHVIGVDLSRKMLARGAAHIQEEHFTDYVTLIHATAVPLPFDDASFDAITCLEALEFLPDPVQALAEMVRVLRPGGLLLVSLRLDIWMPGRVWTSDDMTARLQALGMTHINIMPWQIDYAQVWAQRNGDSAPIGQRPPEELLRCPNCQQTHLMAGAQVWRCTVCAATIGIAADRVVEYEEARRQKR